MTALPPDDPIRPPSPNLYKYQPRPPHAVALLTGYLRSCRLPDRRPSRWPASDKVSGMPRAGAAGMDRDLGVQGLGGEAVDPC